MITWYVLLVKKIEIKECLWIRAWLNNNKWKITQRDRKFTVSQHTLYKGSYHKHINLRNPFLIFIFSWYRQYSNFVFYYNTNALRAPVYQISWESDSSNNSEMIYQLLQVGFRHYRIGNAFRTIPGVQLLLCVIRNPIKFQKREPFCSSRDDSLL